MPILAREADLHPTDLFEGDVASDRAGRWWALYTRSRREKDLMRRLRAMDVAFYGPMIPRCVRCPGGRVLTSYIPLFPNYVFVYGQENARHQALTTHCVSSSIDVKDGAKLTTDLRRIHQLIECGVDVTPEARLQAGMFVRICSGPLAGQEGIVIERQGDRRLLVAVDFLQQGASVLLDQVKLERLDAGLPAERYSAGSCR